MARETSTYLEAFYAVYDIQLYIYNHEEYFDDRYIYPILLSLPGAGKTKSLNYYAKKHNFGIKTLILNQISFDDLFGSDVPVKDENGNIVDLKHINPSWFTELVELANNHELVYLFFDEFTTVDELRKDMVLDLFVYRRFKGTILPDNVLMIAAGNYNEVSMNLATYDRLWVLALDRSLEQLPICAQSSRELKHLLDAKFAKAYPDEFEAPKNNIFDSEFSKIWIQKDSIKEFRKRLGEITLKSSKLMRTSYSPQNFTINDLLNGVQGLSGSFRKIGIVTDALNAANKCGRWYPIIISCSMDNLGRLDESNNLYYSILRELPIEVEKVKLVDNEYSSVEEFISIYDLNYIFGNEDTPGISDEELTNLVPNIADLIDSASDDQLENGTFNHILGYICSRYRDENFRSKLEPKNLEQYKRIIFHRLHSLYRSELDSYGEE